MELYIDNEFAANGSDWLCPLISNQFQSAKIGMASYDSLYMYEGIIDEVKVFKRPDGNIPPSPTNISGVVYGTVDEEYTYTFIPAANMPPRRGSNDLLLLPGYKHYDATRLIIFIMNFVHSSTYHRRKRGY